MENGFFQGAGHIFEKLHEEIARQRFQDEYAGYRVTDGIYIMPAIAGRLAPAEFRHIIYLDGYRAFGDGRHSTTKMCLYVLESYLQSLPAGVKDSMRFLDAGTGTGILAIAARKLGVGEVEAFDIDAGSVESAKSNAALNGCGGMSIVESDIAGFSPGLRYHLVAANLLTDVIMKNTAALCGFVGPGGHMVASGISDMRREEALDALLARGFSMVHSMNDGGWNCFFLRRGE